MKWPEPSLRWLADIYAGGTPSRSEPAYWVGGNVPWLNSGSVNAWEIRSESEWITEQGLRESSARWIPANSVVIALAGQGKTKGLAARLAIPATCNQSLAAIVPNQRLDYRYLHFWLTSQYESIRHQGGGDLRDGLNLNLVGSLRVPLRPLAEQRRIADFLDDQTTRIDQAIHLRQQQVARGVDSVESAAWAFVTGAALSADHRDVSGYLPWASTIPSHWRTPRISHVARIGTGHTPSRSEPLYWTECTIPWLTTGDVHRFRNDEIDEITSTEISISELGIANSAAAKHPPGTVALSRTASAGFSVVMGAEMATSQDFATWTPGPDLNSHFLLWCLRAMRRDLMGRLATGSTHKTIYFPDLMSIRIPLPPVSEQERAVEQIQSTVTNLRDLLAALAASIERLQERKRSLITAAVTGEFDVTTASRTQTHSLTRTGK